eukprot:82236-Pelagomonas_calceolata.AAC.1
MEHLETHMSEMFQGTITQCQRLLATQGLKLEQPMSKGSSASSRCVAAFKVPMKGGLKACGRQPS